MNRAEDIATYGRGFNESDRIPKTGWKPEFKRRCESAGQVFAGGGSQINAIKQDSTGKVYVIGQVRKKKAGKVSCNVQIKGAHCADKDGIPHLASEDSTKYGSENACTSIGGTWKDNSNGNCRALDVSNNSRDLWSKTTFETCMATTPAAATTLVNDVAFTATKVTWSYNQTTDYNNVASSICTETSNVPSGKRIWDWDVTNYAMTTDGSAVTYDSPIFASDWWQCSPAVAVANNNGGDQWLEEYKGLAEVNESTKSLELRSGVDEQAIKLWLIDDVPYYTSYNTSEGRYYLKRYQNGQIQTVAANFEIYNLSEGNSADSFYYDGLNFETNEYSFGTIDKSSLEMSKKTGLTGQVKMIVKLPK